VVYTKRCQTKLNIFILDQNITNSLEAKIIFYISSIKNGLNRLLSLPMENGRNLFALFWNRIQDTSKSFQNLLVTCSLYICCFILIYSCNTIILPYINIYVEVGHTTIQEAYLNVI
jgi:hypothetical protein